MQTYAYIMTIVTILMCAGSQLRAQSLYQVGQQVAASQQKLTDTPQDPVIAGSYFATQPPAPRHFRVNDLLTIIIRQKLEVSHDGGMETEQTFGIEGSLDDWIRLKNHNLIPDEQSNGDPKIAMDIERSSENEAKRQRTDEISTRMTCRIIDVLPNDTLVIEGRNRIDSDGEIQVVTVTGTCRAEDVSADNTILSTQIHDFNLVREGKGAVRDAEHRGIVTKILDFINPF